jgi:hypothetical protein
MTHLTLEQCQRLKEIGFPQYTERSFFEDLTGLGTPSTHRSPATRPVFEHEPNGDDEGYLCSCPTLEELIEWLGDDIGCLSRDMTTYPDPHHSQWVAVQARYKSFGNYPDSWAMDRSGFEIVENDPQIRKFGSNPLEAIYSLALAIHSK